MKKLFILLSLFAMTTSCNSGKKPQKESKPASALDSLLNEIDKGHMEGMGKIGRLHNTRKSVQALIDSIAKLPAKTKQTSAALLENLKTTIKDIDYADMAMDKWMTEYVEDSAMSNEQARLEYLSGERSKIDNIKTAIRNSLQKADSLLKVKF